MSESDNTNYRLRDRIRGVIYGTAIGDSLGYPVEFLDVRPSQPLVNNLVNDPTVGSALYSDDTQMMRATFEGLWRARTHTNLDRAAEEVAAEYIAWSKSPENNRSPGNSCMTGCYNLESGIPWMKAGKQNGGGCGAAMRSMAYGVWLWRSEARAINWAAQHALMTHRSRMAQASAAAVAAGVVSALNGDQPDAMAIAMIDAAGLYDRETSRMLQATVEDAEADAEDVLDRWRGWAGHEAVAASLWCFLQHPDEYAKAVLLAVNSPGDSDSLGAITGALSGARLGAMAMPEAWLRNIEDTDGLGNLSFRIYEATK